jgi:excisionase family DNA binding protein
MTTSDHDFCTIAEAADLLRVSKPTIRRWIGSGKLRAVRLAGRSIRIRRGDLEALLEPVGLRLSETQAEPYGAQVQTEGDPLIRELREFQDRILARRGGKLMSDSVPIIRAAREARMADIQRWAREARKRAP